MRMALLLLALTALVIQSAYSRNEERGNRGKYKLYKSSERSQTGQAQSSQAIIKKLMRKEQATINTAKPSAPTKIYPTRPTAPPTHPQLTPQIPDEPTCIIIKPEIAPPPPPPPPPIPPPTPPPTPRSTETAPQFSNVNDDEYEDDELLPEDDANYSDAAPLDDKVEKRPGERSVQNKDGVGDNTANKDDHSSQSRLFTNSRRHRHIIRLSN